MINIKNKFKIIKLNFKITLVFCLKKQNKIVKMKNLDFPLTSNRLHIIFDIHQFRAIMLSFINSLQIVMIFAIKLALFVRFAY